jgi:hypothetical protein
MSKGLYWNGKAWVKQEEFRRPAPVIRAKPSRPQGTRAPPPPTEQPPEENDDDHE